MRALAGVWSSGHWVPLDSLHCMKNLSPVHSDGAFIIISFATDRYRAMPYGVTTTSAPCTNCPRSLTANPCASWCIFVTPLGTARFVTPYEEFKPRPFGRGFYYNLFCNRSIPSYALWCNDYLRTGHELVVGPADRRYDQLHMRALVGV